MHQERQQKRRQKREKKKQQEAGEVSSPSTERRTLTQRLSVKIVRGDGEREDEKEKETNRMPTRSSVVLSHGFKDLTRRVREGEKRETGKEKKSHFASVGVPHTFKITGMLTSFPFIAHEQTQT
mmetsp:Transcript_13258/g.26145  ORF Transcript_13258/g.26145 Transcript_13258/m.26145 type:complete len:124 (-) Transcript_13258:1219-1590(-)